MRQQLSLAGTWQFQLDPQGVLELGQVSFPLEVRVPAPWQAQEGLHEAIGVGWYRRTIDVPQAWILADRTVLLTFGAVDYIADVFVNGKPAGQHEGGYLPFELNVTALLKPGRNVIAVRAADMLDTFAEAPHGKQSWYGPISGIWQDVTLESRPVKHIRSLRISPHDEQVDVEVVLSEPLAARDSVRIEVFGPDGRSVASVKSAEAKVTLDVKAPQLWDIDTPNLYTVRATLTNGDSISDTFGFRTIEARDGKLWLNGRPVYLRSALDQDYYPDLIYTPPSLDYIEEQFRKAKALGLNSLRIHIKVGDPRYYIAADRVGLLIWTEMPNWQVLTEKTKAHAKDTFIGMVERDWNRPSIIIRTIINEAWGVDIYDPSQRQWMAETYDWLKALDPSRLVVDNSACNSNFHVVSDIDDMHVYYTVPDHYKEFSDWTAKFAKRPVWTYTPQLSSLDQRRKFLRGQWDATWAKPSAEVRRSGNEPLIVSEFGNWGLPDVAALKAYYAAHYGNAEPWWFKTGLQHGEGQVYPDGIEQRFDLYALNRVWPTLSDLSKASQNMEYVALKYELEEMRKHPSIQGYVITEFTDLHWECNGLLDMVRNPKSFHDVFADINADDVIIPQWTRVAFWDGERVKVSLSVSQYSARDLAGSAIEWELEGTDLRGRIDDIFPTVADVVDASFVSFKAPAVSTSTKARLVLRLVTPGPGGETVTARNHLDLYFFPRASAQATTQAKVYSPEYADALRDLGYTVVRNIRDAELVVTGVLTEALRTYLLEGGKVLWMADGEDAQQTILTGMGGAQVGPRKGTPWTGDWASNFNWLCQDVMFKDIPTNGTVDFAFADLTPDNVIHGVHPLHFQNQVHSGLFLGWIHKVVALVAERQIGSAGKLLISTYRLSKSLTTHPVAAIMLRDMVARLAG